MDMGPNKESGPPVLPVLSCRSAITRITDLILARSRQRAFIIRDRYLVEMVHQMCPISRINNMKLFKLRMSTSCNLAPFVFVCFNFPGPYLARAMDNRRTFSNFPEPVIICQNTGVGG